MNRLSKEISRKEFLQGAVGVMAGAAFLSMPNLSFASKARARTIHVKDLPNALELAKNSQLVTMSNKIILDYVHSIKDPSLRTKTLAILENPTPQIMDLYKSSSSISALYEKLLALGLVDSSKTPRDKLLPPFNGKMPQPFYAAPGSGYGSHHAYPGGLATHTGSNMIISEGIYDTYKKIYDSPISRDIIISAQALHDLAKPWVFQWQSDNSSLKEYPIAGTGAHHILSIAEVIYRGFPAEEIVAQACAHNHPNGAKNEAEVAGWIKAASIIAQKDPVALGLLSPDGKIPAPHKQEGYIIHLGDHDFVLSSPACQKSVLLLGNIAQKEYGIQVNSPTFNKFRNYIGAEVGMMHINALHGEKDGVAKVTALVKSIILK